MRPGSRRFARYCVKITGAPRVQTGWAPSRNMCEVSMVEGDGYVRAANESRTNYNGVHRVSAGNKRKRETTMRRFGRLSETLGRHRIVGASHQASRIGAFSGMCEETRAENGECRVCVHRHRWALCVSIAIAMCVSNGSVRPV